MRSTSLTPPSWLGWLGSRADEEPVLRDFVDVDVRSLNALKRRGVDWFECLSRANLEDSIKRRYIYYKARVAGKWLIGLGT